MEIKKKSFSWLLLVLLFTLPAIVSLLRPGFFLTDDGEWMIIRFSAFHQELVRGQFPVRWLNRLNNGYGYPVATFLYPGFMYLAETPKLLGFGFVDSIKAVFIISVFSASVFSFYWLKRLFKEKAAFLGSLVYIYSPYFLWDVYKRGSVGEVLALGIVPFIMWNIEKRDLRLTAIGYGLLIIAHNSLALLFIPFLLIYTSVRQCVSASVRPLLLGLGLSAFFWLPAVLELKYTVFSQVAVSNWEDYFLKVKDFTLLGWFNLLIGLSAILFFLKDIHTRNATAMLVCIFFFLGVFTSLSFSSFLWRIFPLGKFVQFPFRFLSWEVVAGSYLASMVVNQIEKEWQGKVVAILVSLVIFLGFPFSKPKHFINKPDSYYTTNEATTTVQDEYMPRWVKIKPERRAEERMERVDEETVQINTIYWSGWKVFVNGEEKEIDYNNETGFMRVKVPPGKYEVKLVFRETPPRLLANLISFISLILIVFCLPRFYIEEEERKLF